MRKRTNKAPLSLVTLAMVGVIPWAAKAETNCYGNQTTNYDATRTTLARVQGAVVDTDTGLPVSDASATVRNTVVCTLDSGFLIHSLLKKNGTLYVRHPDYYTEAIPIQLNVPGDNVLITMSPIKLRRRGDDPSLTRFLFGGDVALGRRYFDPSADQFYPRTIIPPDLDEALIHASAPEVGTAAVVSGLAPLYSDKTADYHVLNLETPVIHDPATPHNAKDHAFFTLPGSLIPLKHLGVDYVSLGNNHVYDYLQRGIEDTLSFVNLAGLGHSGAGRDNDEAFQPHRYGPFSLLSFSSLSGNQFSSPDLTLHASETKGGSANLADSRRVGETISREQRAGFFPIAQLHTGKEYTYEPSSFASTKMRAVAEAGASLVVGHHPHVAQGFGMHAGVPIIHSLGNLVFDSDRLETVLGLTVYADLWKGKVQKLSGVPIYIEDYKPQLLTGQLANRLIRRLGEFSWSGTTVFPENFRAVVSYTPTTIAHSVRTVSCSLVIGPDGVGIMDLRSDPDSACRLDSHESLQTLEIISGSPNSVQVGRDIMLFGEMEDYDADLDHREATEWYLEPGSLKVCSSAAHTGTSGICSSRTDERDDDSVLKLRKRMRVIGDADNVPNKDLSVLGYVRADNAGEIKLRVTYSASELDREFGEQDFVVGSGTFGWTRIVRDLTMPPDQDHSFIQDPKTDNARSVVLTIRHAAPQVGTGIARYDDFALVNWEKPLSVSEVTRFHYPNLREFIRVRGAPGIYKIEVSFRSSRTR
jgi:poly-gamma-glutamate capsule biosynthesis protein CapA/YwtB (metallophosphatase superfamily)